MNNNLALLKTTDPLMAVGQADIADSTKTQYRRALTRYFRETGAGINDIDALTSHAASLPKSSRAFLKAVVKLHTQNLARAYKGQATAQNATKCKRPSIGSKRFRMPSR